MFNYLVKQSFPPQIRFLIFVFFFLKFLKTYALVCQCVYSRLSFLIVTHLQHYQGYPIQHFIWGSTIEHRKIRLLLNKDVLHNLVEEGGPRHQAYVRNKPSCACQTRVRVDSYKTHRHYIQSRLIRGKYCSCRADINMFERRSNSSIYTVKGGRAWSSCPNTWTWRGCGQWQMQLCYEFIDCLRMSPLD